MIYGNKFLNYGITSFDGSLLIESDIENINTLLESLDIVNEAVSFKEIFSKVFSKIKEFVGKILKWISNMMKFLSDKLMKFFKKTIDSIKKNKDEIDNKEIKEAASHVKRFGIINVDHVRVNYNDTRELIKLMVEYGDKIHEDIGWMITANTSETLVSSRIKDHEAKLSSEFKHQKEYERIKELLSKFSESEFDNFFEIQKTEISDNINDPVSKALIDHIEYNQREINIELKDLTNFQNSVKSFEKSFDTYQKSIDRIDDIYSKKSDEEKKNASVINGQIRTMLTEYTTIIPKAIEKIIRFYQRAVQINLQSVVDIHKYAMVDKDEIERIKNDFAAVNETPKEMKDRLQLQHLRYLNDMSNPHFKKMI